MIATDAQSLSNWAPALYFDDLPADPLPRREPLGEQRSRDRTGHRHARGGEERRKRTGDGHLAQRIEAVAPAVDLHEVEALAAGAG